MNDTRLVGVGQKHVEILWNPISVNNAAKASDYINLAGYDHISMMFHFGAIASGFDGDLTIIADSASSSTHANTLATIKYRLKKSTAQWGAMTSVTDSKIDIVAGGEIVPSTDDNCILLVEIDTADLLALDTTYNMQYVWVNISDGGAYAYVSSAVAILSKGRYRAHQPDSAL